MASKNLELYLVGKDLSASKAVKGLGTQLDKTAASGSRMGTALKTGLAVGAGAAVALGVSAVHMAMQFQDAQVRLESAVKNVGGSFDQLKPKVDDLDGKMAKLGFTGTEVESSLAGLVTATKDPTKAISLMGLAADIARGRNIDLATATNILVKVETGHVALLGRLGIATKDATGKTISQDEAVRRLTDLYGGDAQRSADTFAGKMRTLKAESEDLGVKLGTALIPAVDTLASVLLGTVGAAEGVAHWLNQNETEAIVLAAVLTAALLPALGRLAFTAAEAGLARLTSLFGGLTTRSLAFATSLNPVSIALAVVTAEVALGVVTWRHWSSEVSKARDASQQAVGSFLDMQAPLVDLENKSESFGHHWYHGIIDPLQRSRAAEHSASSALEHLNANVDNLSNRYGINRDQAILLAQATGNDLTKAMRVSNVQITSWISKAILADSSTRRFGASTLLLSAYVQTAKDKTTAFSNALKILANMGQNATVSQVHFKQAVSDLVKNVQHGTKSINENTDAGRMNFDMVNNAILEAENNSNAIYNQELATKGVTVATLDATNALDHNITALENEAVKAGVSKSAFDALLKQMGLLPSNIETDFSTPGLAEAQRAVDAFARSVQTVPVSVTVRSNGLSAHGYADGGWVSGPIGSPQPAIVHGGEFVLSRKMLAGVASGRSAPMVASSSREVHNHVHLYGVMAGSEQQLLRWVDRGLKRMSGKGYATNN